MNKALQSKMYRTGYYVSLFGTILILLWEGILKFTPTEAKGIKHLVENSPFTFWMYKIWDVQTVSIIFGVGELCTVLLLILSIKISKLRIFAALGMMGIFLVTLSFLFTTPGTARTMDGIPATNFFLVKDLMYLGFALMLVNPPHEAHSR